jgi:hypothetical protein
VATVDDLQRILASLPEVTEGVRHGNTTWYVRTRAFAWMRPFSKADVRRFGDDPVPSGPIVAVVVDDLLEKEAVLSSGTRGIFTIAHFDDYPAVLVQLDVVAKEGLRNALVDGWLAAAPDALAAAFLGSGIPDR